MHRRSSYLRIRRLVYHMLGGEGHTDGRVKAIDIALICLITLNVAAVMLESITWLSVAHGPYFQAFDTISVAIFTVEYLARIWTCVEDQQFQVKHGRLRYMVTPMALIDLAGILPFYIHTIWPFDLRTIRVLRLLRILKLTRYSSAMTVLMAVLRQETRAIGAIIFIMAVVMVFTASLMYLFEHTAQPEVFADIPTALWWAVVTLTTLGYGDMVPVTPWGRVLGGLTAVIGVGLVALPAGVLASGFSEEMRIRREEYQQRVERALQDGRLTRRERRSLEDLRHELGLSHDEAERILHESARHRHAVCPHCGVPLSQPATMPHAGPGSFSTPAPGKDHEPAKG
jgi:voltage-gated potassium channel